MNRWIIVFTLTLVLGSAWLWLSRVPVDAVETVREPEPAVGHPAPDFTLASIDGELLSLSDYAGRPVIINFWASWCPSCVAEMSAAFRPVQHDLGDEITFIDSVVR